VDPAMLSSVASTYVIDLEGREYHKRKSYFMTNESNCLFVETQGFEMRSALCNAMEKHLLCEFLKATSPPRVVRSLKL
jgi:hypothetical protein